MENKASYFYVGVFVFGVLFVALFVIMWLGGFLHKEKFVYYQLFTNDSIAGLSPKAPVKLLGVEVGSVEDANISSEHGVVGVRILLKLKEGTPITHNTYATLTGQGITGIKFVELATESGGNSALRLPKEGEIQSIPVKPSLLSAIDRQGDKIIKLADYISEQLHLIFSEENVRNFSKILRNFAQINKDLEPTLSNFSDASRKMADMADNYGDMKGSLSSNLELFELLLIQLNETLTNLKQSPSDIFFKSGKNKLAPGE